MGLALAAQWTRIRLPVQGTQDPWPGKVSHAWSNRPMHHKYVGATANAQSHSHGHFWALEQTGSSTQRPHPTFCLLTAKVVCSKTDVSLPFNVQDSQGLKKERETTYRVVKEAEGIIFTQRKA